VEPRILQRIIKEVTEAIQVTIIKRQNSYKYVELKTGYVSLLSPDI